jgi:hypothetical protein
MTFKNKTMEVNFFALRKILAQELGEVIAILNASIDEEAREVKVPTSLIDKPLKEARAILGILLAMRTRTETEQEDKELEELEDNTPFFNPEN